MPLTFRPFPGSETTQERETRILNANYRVVPMESNSLRSYLVGFTREDTDYELDSEFGIQAHCRPRRADHHLLH